MKTATGFRIVLPNYADTQTQAIDELLHLDSVQFPNTTQLKPTDTVIRVKSAVVSFVDFIMMTGQYQHMIPPPYVPGLEFSGEIAWAGSDVKRFKVGDKVFSDYMTVGPRSKGDYQSSGAWTSFAVAPESGIHPIPDAFSFPQACSFLVNTETAYFALVKRANVQTGERVLITGASGASGLASVQIAKILGAEVFVVGRSRGKLETVLSMGADHAIEVNSEDPAACTRKLRREIDALTGGTGVDVVVDTVGGHIGQSALRTLAFEGRFIIVGWASNVSSSGGRKTFVSGQLPTNIMQMKCLKVMGSPMVIYSMANPQWRTDQMAQLFSWAEAGLLPPHVSHEFAAQDFQKAAKAKFHGEVVGSCVMNF